MTPAEKKLVADCMENYPQGVDPVAWGYGPMEKVVGMGLPEPEMFLDEELAEYG